jgi:hypothetical protein
VPDVLVRICSKANFFDLSENKFKFPSEASEAGGGRTHLQHVVEHVRNMQKVTEVDLRNQQDLIGKCKQIKRGGTGDRLVCFNRDCLCADIDGLQYYEHLARLNLSSCR